jgi:hypothetical protein
MDVKSAYENEWDKEESHWERRSQRHFDTSGASREATSKLGYNGTCAGLTLTTPRIHEIDQRPGSRNIRAKTLALVD